MDNIAYLSLGSNIGEREKFLLDAVRELKNTEGICVKQVSSIYETDPVGYTDQAPFLNMAVKIATSLSPEELLSKCLFIEKTLGRVRKYKWGPRKIDLDILLYNTENIEMEVLQIPHPRMTERAFVLVPLLEIDGTLELPNNDVSLAKRLDEIPDKEGVRLWKQINGEGASALFEN
ncbi:2-amino-4-hydroxy-6-hydroxymethyldihydropteridine diphosphokinase [Siminovitchia sp. FSL H7-0308]|uniref:2-amino-4-hydroxy-6-hydroxymethyldihydropteridine diphosphokinase n=1 Tax=Siminovitchia thermophila TaxID=1245522 RepID=A0ABS2RDK3_9BACI|nr:2-amino-4-hydroxy-6-hydroxymethyldihydropteridine diphosphokinase [Siminovitchia thermophila]MBM7716671.1 2-amino-4-hydroxy-6-hydroxymethyldihydropteridine diphosphokinase [Siminovitchia thermophila]ONK23102.1 2-amino-4-hydroxy-6-hydroxymethyldihydropteridine diphosphokinase [Bacillus sp. VT-16-64]